MLNLQNHLPTMRNYGKLVAKCGIKPSTYYERTMVKLVVNFGTKSSTYYEKTMVNLQNQLPTMRNNGKLVANCSTKQLCQVKENHLLTMRNYAKLAKSSTYDEKLW